MVKTDIKSVVPISPMASVLDARASRTMSMQGANKSGARIAVPRDRFAAMNLENPRSLKALDGSRMRTN
jgi:hypothetical protein